MVDTEDSDELRFRGDGRVAGVLAESVEGTELLAESGEGSAELLAESGEGSAVLLAEFGEGRVELLAES